MNVRSILTGLGVVVIGTFRSDAEGFRLEQIGARTGFSATRLSQYFHQTEAYLRVDSPCRLELGREWRLRTGIDVTAGVLWRDEDRGFVGTLGPVFTLGRASFPLELVAGTSATYLSRDEFGGVRFGIPFQFTSHIGVDLHVGSHWTAAYRLQHMSNGGISPHNPGLDLHVVAIGYQF